MAPLTKGLRTVYCRIVGETNKIKQLGIPKSPIFNKNARFDRRLGKIAFFL